MINMLYEGKEPFVFVSFDSNDCDKVFPILEALSKRGIRIWYYTNVSGTSLTQDRIASRLNDSSVILAFVSKNSLDSQSFRKELNFAIELNKEQIIIYLEEVEISLGMRMRLGLVQSMFYSRHKSADSFLDELCRSNIISKTRSTSGHVTAEETYRNGMTNYECGHYDEAVHLFENAANQGHAQAQYKMSRCYDLGHGVNRNTNIAVKWLLKAAAQDHPQALADLGNAYYKGIGVAKNDKEAIYWYKKAAEHGSPEALCGLGIVYCYGEGVQDAMEAVRCFQKAARLGSSYAQEILIDIGIPW